MLYELHVAAHLLVLPLLGGVIYWIYRSSEGKAAWAMIALLAVDTVWVVLLTVQLLAPIPAKEFLYPINTAVGAIAPFVWFVFALYYTGRETWLTRPVWTLLGGLAGSIGLVVSTNNVHHLIYSEFVRIEEPFPYIVAEETALQIAISVVVLGVAVGGLVVLVDFILSTRHLSRAQSATIVGGGAIAMVINLLWVFRQGPVPGFNYSGIATGIFGIAIGWSLFNDRLFRVAPVARDSVFASFADPLVAIDVENKVVDFNAAASEVFPEIESYLGEPLSDLEPDLFVDGGDLADQFAKEIGAQQRSFRIDSSSIEAGNRQVGVALHLRDVTALESYAEQLERRTDQLETKTEQLEQFASSVSHDLRNPINVAQARIDMTEETGELDHLQDAEEALERGLETIERLLELARSGQTIGDPEPVRLDAIVSNAWAAVDTDAATLVNDTEGTIAADRDRLQGLLENLFRNSVEHGASDVTVTVATTDDGFVVADDGPGIPEDEREKVFDHGYTGGGGTGLGLAKVEAIAIAHDWSVAVEESADGGACFRFDNVEFVEEESEENETSFQYDNLTFGS